MENNNVENKNLVKILNCSCSSYRLYHYRWRYLSICKYEK